MPKSPSPILAADARREASDAAGALKRYREMRDFEVTPEPDGVSRSGATSIQPDRSGGGRSPAARSYVVQKHAARRLHYDFRLELGGTLKSWAVPKGPSLDPAQRRMAVRVEDHPLAYASFEGEIPRGNYGAGTVMVWDRGYWLPVDNDPDAALRAGKLKFTLYGEKLKGGYTLVRTRGRPHERQESWLLIKERDEAARPEAGLSIVDERPESVHSSAAARPPGPPAAQPAPGQSRRLPEIPPQARRAALPDQLEPALATLVRSPPSSGDWDYELKFDGYRLLARIDERNSPKLFTRNGHDWTARLPALARALEQMQIGAGWIDGEIVVLGEDGTPDFQALQNAFDTTNVEAVRYFLFDLPFHDGYDLRAVPLRRRRERLRALLTNAAAHPPNVLFSEDFAADIEDLLSSACDLDIEGLIGKRSDSPYPGGRSKDWIKLKCASSQEFVIGGYTDPQGTRSGFGSLLLGVHENGQLRYVGNVGAGFGRESLKNLHVQLESRQQPRSPFADGPPARTTVHWVRPDLVVEVAFGSWTREGRVRHSVFKGLRRDKPASSVRRERAIAAPGPRRDDPGPTRAAGAPEQASPTKKRAGGSAIRITSPERIVDPASGATKRDVIDYCERAADLLLAQLARRPVALLRAPAGVGQKQFFQKHANAKTLREITRLDPAIDRDHEPLLAIDTPSALLSAAQMNVLEFHTWNATTRAIERPDRMVFDLDPGEGVGWREVVEGALLVNDFLDALGLRAFLKSSGGRGLHLVVPLTPRHGWQEVKDFSHGIVRHLSANARDRFVAKSGPRNRIGRIFIDYLRNGRGATTVAAFSPRARPGLPISLPLAWEELPGLASSEIASIFTDRQRLERAAHAWSGYASTRQTLTAAMKKLGPVAESR